MEKDLQHRTKLFSLEVVNFYSSLLKGDVFYALGKQLLRCSPQLVQIQAQPLEEEA